MTVSAQTPLNRSTANGVTTVFPYNFKVLAAADLEVSIDGVVKTLTTHYTLSGVGDDGGGNVTMLSAPTAGGIVVRRRNMAYTRVTDYQDQGELPTATLDADFDASVLLSQQLAEGLERAVKVPITSDLDPAQLIADLTQASIDAVAAADAAAISETNAAASASIASAAATSATASASTASTAATSATASASAASTSATSATSSASAASTSASGASSSATTASTAATNAGNSATAAATSATNAASSATAAAGSATSASGSATAAGTSATNAASSAAAAAASAASVVGVPVGGVVYIGASSAPSGFLKANGAAVSRSTYSALFAVIGITFGAGDGSTTFNLPDLRGEFVRGLDDGRGVDTSRVLGSAQADGMKTHTHGMSGAIQDDGGVAYNISGGARGSAVNTTGNNSGAISETRPRNIALLAVIKH
ncbi:MAG: phage tail fiber protein [Pseudomonadota bacterium]